MSYNNFTQEFLDSVELRDTPLDSRRFIKFEDRPEEFILPYPPDRDAENFYKTGLSYPFSIKGTRPQLHLAYQWEGTEVTESYKYLIKFSDKTVWLCDEDIDYYRNPPSSESVNNIKIFDKAQDVKEIILEMQGGGGGGAGGSAMLAGAGGAGGSYLLVKFNLVHDASPDGFWKRNSIRLHSGGGGKGSWNREGAQRGGDTGIYYNNSVGLLAVGGYGSSGGGQGSHRNNLVSGIPFSSVIANLVGNDATNASGNTYETIITKEFSYPGELNTLTYPSHSAGAGYGGSGGCSVLGTGGRAASFGGYNGDNGTGYGAGGGGGSAKSFSNTKGGDGTLGVLRIYY